MRKGKPVGIYVNMLRSCFREIRREAQLEDMPGFHHKYFSEEELGLAFDHRVIPGDSYLLHLALRRGESKYKKHLLATTGRATRKDVQALRKRISRERERIYFFLKQHYALMADAKLQDLATDDQDYCRGWSQNELTALMLAQGSGSIRRVSDTGYG